MYCTLLPNCHKLYYVISQGEDVSEKPLQTKPQVHPDERESQQISPLKPSQPPLKLPATPSKSPLKLPALPESQTKTSTETQSKTQADGHSEALTESKCEVQTETQVKVLGEAQTQAQVNKEKQLNFEAKLKQLQHGQSAQSPHVQVNSDVPFSTCNIWTSRIQYLTVLKSSFFFSLKNQARHFG